MFILTGIFATNAKEMQQYLKKTLERQTNLFARDVVRIYNVPNSFPCLATCVTSFAPNRTIHVITLSCDKKEAKLLIYPRTNKYVASNGQKDLVMNESVMAAWIVRPLPLIVNPGQNPDFNVMEKLVDSLLDHPPYNDSVFDHEAQDREIEALEASDLLRNKRPTLIGAYCKNQRRNNKFRVAFFLVPYDKCKSIVYHEKNKNRSKKNQKKRDAFVKMYNFAGVAVEPAYAATNATMTIDDSGTTGYAPWHRHM